MTKKLALILALVLLTVFCAASAEEPLRGEEERAVDTAVFFSDLAAASKALQLIDEDTEALEDELISAVAEDWKRIYLNPDYRIWLDGKDDPAGLPVSGKHAFVVLGYALADGRMQDELKSRCEAAAAAARAFPESILICTGGATGDNNPERHTEAGLMKEYLVKQCGLDSERIFTEERAADTVGNAVNTFEILKEQHIEEITLVTSDYHQRRANVLFSALAAFIRKTEGYSAALAGNYACKTEKGYDGRKDADIAAAQLDGMFRHLNSGLREAREIIVNHGAYGEAAEERNAELFARMRAVNPENAEKWEEITDLWKTVNTDITIHEDILPDGLPDTDELCIVALGFQLNPDGSMRDELTERLQVVLRSAEKYPNAVIACTGGGTAAENAEATEAGKMAEWLAGNGISRERILVEDESQTTAQNAIYTLGMLEERFPQVRQLAIVSSDYHIATGTLLFEAESILRAENREQRVRVVSNAAYRAPSGSLSVMFQAGALVELSGDRDMAYEIYYETYDIHELPQKK